MKKFYKNLPVAVKALLIVCFVFAVYSLFGFLALPKIVGYVLENKISTIINRPIRVGEIGFNPYNLELTLNDLEIKRKGAEKKKFFFLHKAKVNFQAASLYKFALVVSELKIIGPRVNILRRKDGSFNFSDLLSKEKDRDKEKQKGSTFHFSINNIELTDGTITFQDRLTNSFHKVEKLSIGIPFISNTKQYVKIYVQPHFYAIINGSPIEFKGKTRPFAKDMDTDIQIAFKRVSIPKYLCYVPKVLGLNLDSAILDSDIYLHFLMKKDNPKILINGSIKISDISISKNNKKLIKLDSLVAEVKESDLLYRGINLNLILNKLKLNNIDNKEKFLNISQLIFNDIKLNFPEKDIIFTKIKIKKPEVNFLISKLGDNNVNIFSSYLLKNNSTVQTHNNQKIIEKKDDDSNYKVIVNELELQSGILRFADKSAPKEVSFDSKNLNIKIKNFIFGQKQPFNFSLSANIGLKGSILIKGTSSGDFEKISGEINTTEIFLPVFQGYLADILNLDFAKGDLNTKMAFSYEQNKKLFKVSGDFSIDNVFMFDRLISGPFVKWKRIEAKGFSFKNNPLEIVVSKINIVKLHEEMVRLEDGSLNVARIFKQKEAKNKDKSNNDNKNKDSLNLKIDEVNFSSCSIRVVDKSVTPTFVREFNNISGKIKGLSNSPDMKANILITALVDNRSHLQIKGDLNPLAKPIYANINLDIEGAGVTRFSPYAEKFLGYKIDKGKLFLHLKVKIENDELKVDNRFVLDQFELGQRVESKDAINAPIKLAIALLKDRSGKIDLDIPVSGRLDDPEFSYRSAVLTALVNIFIKAATSPFSLLSSIVGASETLDKIDFEYGKFTLSEKAKKKLDTLAKALNNRPSLKVDVTGFYDPIKDKEALLEIYFMRLLKKEKFQDLSEKERRKIVSIDDVPIEKDEYEKYLTEAYKHAKFKRPRNFIGLLKSQPVDKMEKMLKEHIDIDRSSLRNLAQERAKAVANYLIYVGKVDANRIFIVAPKNQEEINRVSAPIVQFSLK